MKYIKFLVGAFLFLSLFFAASDKALAAADPVDFSRLNYPINELGSCKDRADCEKYCSQSANMLACVNYAEKNNLLSGEDLRISKLVANKVSKEGTPGNCRTKDECESFCKGKVENINQCLAFGEELGVIPEAELQQAKKIAKALSEGIKMPGNCTTKESCESYCAIGSNIDECLSFAEKAQILPVEELREAKLVAKYIKEGSTPGKCTNKDSCKQYCNDAGHWEECINFAESAQLISAEEAAIAKKAGGAGPGGCKSQKECEDYCNVAANYDECVEFGFSKDILTDKEKDLVVNGLENMKKALEGLPEDLRSETMQCLENSIGKDKFARIMAKQEPITKAVGSQIENCFSGIAEKAKAKAMQDVPGQPESSSGGMTDQTPDISCDNFTAVPSCDLIPEGVARDACNRCK
jgi:hypothetical protein